jgi:hypothetical protein
MSIPKIVFVGGFLGAAKTADFEGGASLGNA